MTPGSTPAKFEKYEIKVKKLVKDAVNKMDGDGEDKLTPEEKNFQKEAFAKLNEMGVKKRLKVMIDTQEELGVLTDMIQDRRLESFAKYVEKDSEEDIITKEGRDIDIEKTKLMAAKDLLGKSPAELQVLFLKKNGEIDFHGNADAERHIGLGDLLEPSQVWVKVDGVLGKRSFAGKKVGYLTSGEQYLPIFGGEKVELLKDEDLITDEKKSYEKIRPATDESVLKAHFLNDVIAFGEPEENINNGENLKRNALWENP